LRIWKFAAMACLCCALLGGCGPSSDMKTAAESAAPAAQQEQVEMAVPEKGIPVLMYHMIGDVPDNDAVLLESHFREQMQFLKDNGFHPITLQQLHEYMTEGKAVPVKPVVLTFDDGYPDTYSIVMPVMKEFGFPCTVFIPTYDADQGTRLTWQQIQEMKDAGITIASHSYRHERLTELSAAAVEEDVQKSQEALKQRLGIDNEFFCYPYGRVNEAVEDVMKKHGVKLAVTMNPGWAKRGDNPYAVNRIWIGNAVDIENFEQRVTTEQYEER
jgi:peptidoglycan/xylan/chitin deacetylase (PgdA/CDA1 family)